MPPTNDLAAHLPAVAWMAERAGPAHAFTVRDVNDAAQAILGYSRDAWRGASEFWLRITHEDDRERAQRHMHNVLESSTDAPLLVRWMHADGRSLPMEVHLARVTDIEGTVIGLHGVALEAARWSKVHGELCRTREHVASLSLRATLNDLARSLVHEMNQPLNAIQNNAEAARIVLDPAGAKASDVAAMLDDIIAANERAGGIIRRARGLVKTGERSGKPVDIDAIVSDVCELLASVALMRNAAIVRHPAELPCHALADRGQLVQVLLNLVGNALDAVASAPAGARSVEISVIAPPGRWIAVCVIDTGSGIGASMLPTVFEPLASTKADGLGLGLDIASSIVAAHGGRMWAGNNRDGGAHFVVALPRA